MNPYLGIGVFALIIIGFGVFVGHWEHEERMLKMKLSAQTQATTAPAEKF